MFLKVFVESYYLGPNYKSISDIFFERQIKQFMWYT
jgi:hypothetical protein